jgi:hypothetical protein
VTPQDLRDYARRDWQRLATLKARRWAETFVPGELPRGWRVAQALRVAVRRQRPDFPTARERQEDAAAHARLASLLARAADAFGRR